MPPLTASPTTPPLPLFRPRNALGVHERMSKNPDLVRVRPGIYAARAPWRLLQPWERYLARVHAFALVSPGAVFSHESAAALHGLPLFGEPRNIHVFDPARAGSRRFNDVIVHTSRDGRMIESCGDLSATDVAHTALDLVRVLPPAFGLAVIDRALQTCTPVDLAQLATAQSSKRGIRLLRWAIAHADARSESVGESVSRAVIHWLGFEAPDLQVELRSEGFVDRVNFAWRGARVIGELDGYGKYDAGDPGTTKARLIAEKVREDRLRRGRASFVRWDWAAMMQAAPLGDRLREAGVARAGPPQPAMLATLARNPRSYAYASGG